MAWTWILGKKVILLDAGIQPVQADGELIGVPLCPAWNRLETCPAWGRLIAQQPGQDLPTSAFTLRHW